MRARFFGKEASTKKTRDDLIANVPRYEHCDLDIRDASAVAGLFQRHRGKIDAIVGSPRGSQDANWIDAGSVYEFRLYNADHSELLKKLVVTKATP